jgi:hypothetical protein
MNIEFKLALILSEAISRDYHDLKAIGLAHPQKAGWTIEDVLSALRGPITTMAKRYHDKLKNYNKSPQGQAVEDYIQTGLIRAWELYKTENLYDGRIPWASWALAEAQHYMSRAMRKGQLIPNTVAKPFDVKAFQASQPENPRSRDYDRGGYDRLAHVPSDNPGTEKIRCPQCLNNHDDRPDCNLCKGKGKIVVPNKRSALTPAEELEMKDWVTQHRDLLRQLIQGERPASTDPDGEGEWLRSGSGREPLPLTPHQVVMLLLYYGAEGVYDDSINSSDEEKQPTEITRIIGDGGAIRELYRYAMERGGEQGQSAFDYAWQEVFGLFGYEYSSTIPIALQISSMPREDRQDVVLRFKDAMSQRIEIGSNVGEPRYKSATSVKALVDRSLKNLRNGLVLDMNWQFDKKARQ